MIGRESVPGRPHLLVQGNRIYKLSDVVEVDALIEQLTANLSVSSGPTCRGGRTGLGELRFAPGGGPKARYVRPSNLPIGHDQGCRLLRLLPNRRTPGPACRPVARTACFFCLARMVDMQTAKTESHTHKDSTQKRLRSPFRSVCRPALRLPVAASRPSPATSLPPCWLRSARSVPTSSHNPTTSREAD